MYVVCVICMLISHLPTYYLYGIILFIYFLMLVGTYIIANVFKNKIDICKHIYYL